MKEAIFNVRFKTLISQRYFLMIAGITLVFSNFLLAFLLLHRHETVILTPPQINKALQYTPNGPSAAYLEEMSIFFASLILDNSEMSFPYKREIILRYVSPNHFSQLKNELLKLQERYKRENLSTSFKPVSIKVTEDQNFVEISGDLISYVGGSRISQTRETYIIQYAFENGFLTIQKFTSRNTYNE